MAQRPTHRLTQFSATLSATTLRSLQQELLIVP